MLEADQPDAGCTTSHADDLCAAEICHDNHSSWATCCCLQVTSWHGSQGRQENSSIYLGLNSFEVQITDNAAACNCSNFKTFH
jgi:hypothetical protein